MMPHTQENNVINANLLPKQSVNILAGQFLKKNLSAHYAEKMNIIRAIAICSVVWGHCLSGLEFKVLNSQADKYIQSALLQTGRIGTLLFFMISGYLLNDKIGQFTVVSYLRYRFQSIILPWLLFVTIVVFIQLSQNLSFYQILSGNKIRLFTLMVNLYKANVFHAAYWFIPVSILSSSLLIAFKKYVQHLWFGSMLCCFTIFYCINLFYRWIPSNHTEAFLGYALFLWIGCQIKEHIYLIIEVLKNISWEILIPLLFVSFVLACREGMILHLLHSGDPYASIRISNAIFSVILFFSLLKSSRFEWIKRFNPRQNIYGIYLVHTIFLILLTPAFTHFINQCNLDKNIMEIICVRLMLFLVILAISYLVVKVIRRSPLHFIIGKNNNTLRAVN